MKARYLYPMLFVVPSVMVAGLASVIVVGAGAGLLWIFVYGDKPWPGAAHAVLMAIAVTVFVLVLARLIIASYALGKNREMHGGPSRLHVLIAIGVTVGLPLLALLHQWQVGNLGSRTVTLRSLAR